MRWIQKFKVYNFVVNAVCQVALKTMSYCWRNFDSLKSALAEKQRVCHSGQNPGLYRLT